MRNPLHLVIIGLCVACNTVGSQKELSAYVMNADNGLIKVVEKPDYKVRAYVVPPDFLITREVAALSELQRTSETVDSIRKQYSQVVRFTIEASVKGKEAIYYGLATPMEYQGRVQGLAFGGETVVEAVNEQGARLELADFQFPRSYGVSNATTIHVAYQLKDIQDADEISIRLNGKLLAIPDQEFVFQVSDILSTPKISDLES